MSTSSPGNSVSKMYLFATGAAVTPRKMRDRRDCQSPRKIRGWKNCQSRAVKRNKGHHTSATRVSAFTCPNRGLSWHPFCSSHHHLVDTFPLFLTLPLTLTLTLALITLMLTLTLTLTLPAVSCRYTAVIVRRARGSFLRTHGIDPT